MRTINKVILLGNLGADVEMRYSETGTAVGKFSLATRFAKKQADGSFDERVEWHKVVTFGPLAEKCSTYLTKGSGVVVEGRLSQHSFEDKEGNRRKITEVVAFDVLFLPRRSPAPGDTVSPTTTPPASAPVEADAPF
jgi:single-strand DNA-binding protein